MLGQLVLNKYRVTRLLDQGGMSKIFLARQTNPDRDVVVKVLKDNLAAQAKAQEHFKREIYIMTRFQHPRAVAYVDSSTRERGGPVLVMEYLRGLDLGLLLQRQGKFTPERAGRLLAQLCDVLQAAHAAGIVHRDLKPGNLMVLNAGTPQESLKLMDFGLARMASLLYISAEEIVDWRLPNAAGTPEYICPEQVRGMDMDGRGDLYSVGAILFEMLTGKRPFQNDNIDALLLAHLQEPPPRFGALGLSVSILPAVEQVVHDCLAKTPNQRPRDAAELLKRYESALGKKLGLAPLPAVPPAAAVSAAAAPRDLDHSAFTHTVEAAMPEAMAMIKIKGFLFDLGGEVQDSIPGMICVRMPPPRGQGKPRGSLFDWMNRVRQNAIPDTPGGIDLELHMERRDPRQPNHLTITLLMRPTAGSMTLEWRNRCQGIGRDLGAYLMGR